jgi:thiol-disulfide isomerase/thioredoxin
MKLRVGLPVAGLLIVATVLVAAVYRGPRHAPAPPQPAGPKVTLKFFRNPTTVPTFTVRDLDGRNVTVAERHGRVTLLNFWASWCGPCRAEIPDLIALQGKYRDQLQVVGISEDEGSPEAVKQFALAHRINYPVAMVTPEIERLFPGVPAIPTSFVIDREGRLVQKHVGLIDASMVEQETRMLAGLPVNATVEEIEDTNRTLIENAAQAKEIPGVDLKALPPAKRTAALQRLNQDSCTCGCGLTLAACRINDPTCGVSLPLARQIVAQIAASR